MSTVTIAVQTDGGTTVTITENARRLSSNESTEAEGPRILALMETATQKVRITLGLDTQKDTDNGSPEVP